MSKRIAFLVALVIIVAILIYKNPVQIHREFLGRTLSTNSGNTEKSVLIGIDGYLHRNLFSQDSFSGSVTIDGKSMNIRTSIPVNLNMRISGMEDKLKGKPILVSATHVERGYVNTVGQVLLSRDFNMVWGYSDYMREQFNDNSITFAGSSDNQQPASEVMKILDLKQY